MHRSCLNSEISRSKVSIFLFFYPSIKSYVHVLTHFGGQGAAGFLLKQYFSRLRVTALPTEIAGTFPKSDTEHIVH